MLQIKSKLTNYFQRKKVVNIHLTIDSNDLTEDKLLEIVQAVGTYGYFTFTPDKLKKRVEEAMKDKTIGIRKSGFSPSQVLRGKIKLLWEKSDSQKTWEEYYTYWMNTLINHFDEKIQKHSN